MLLSLLAITPLAAADLHVNGLGWLGNRTAEQRLKLLLGERAGATFDANLLEDAGLVLISALAEDGYLTPVVTLEATLADGQLLRQPIDAQLEQPLPRPLAATAATLQVQRGPRFTLREIKFTGLLALTEKEARGFFVGENMLFTMDSERIYSPGRLRRSLGNLEESLRQRGYADAAVASTDPAIDATTGEVRVKVIVQEGRRWVVESLRFTVAEGEPPPTPLPGVRLGEPWNALWRQDAATAIRRWYYSRGHPDVQVNFTLQTTNQPDGTKAVAVLATIAPGPEVRVGAVRFTGNRYTRDATLRRLVRSQPGDLFNPIAFDNSQARISRLGVFRTVDLRYAPGDADTRDVIYDLTEGRRQEVNLLAGYGSYEQLRGGIEWRQYNVLGRAHTSTLKLAQSMKSSAADYIYTVPDLFGTTLDGTTRAFGLRREELSFVHEEYGANVSVLWPARRLGFSLTTGYTFKHVRNTDNELATRATDEAESNIGSLDVGLVRDRRDNALRPRHGYKLSLQTEFADRTLGSDVFYQQVVAAASYHTSWGNGRWIHLGLSHGVVTTLGNSDPATVPVSVFFFPGGDGSIRGYQKGEAAPRAANGLFVGAHAYVQGNIELEQALTPKWSVVAFFDALGTAERLADYPFNEKLYSAGLGVRYQTLIGPLRLEYGRNLNPRPLDPSGTVLFSIGFPF